MLSEFPCELSVGEVRGESDVPIFTPSSHVTPPPGNRATIGELLLVRARTIARST
jgi:hypothetical protein